MSRIIDISQQTRHTKIPFHNNWESSGFVAPDMVASAITHARTNGHGIETISLRPRLYKNFIHWLSTKMNEEELAKTAINGFQFDGVNIECGSIVQKENLLMKYYEKQALIN
jgi:hypothetical protein